MHIIESGSMYNIDQDFYMSKIEQIPTDDEFSKFDLMRMILEWLADTRSGVVLEISQIAQVTRAMYDKHIRKLCKR